MAGRLLIGDCRESLRTLPAKSVHCCVTSPPYWGLRDYGVDGQLGLEKSPAEYVAGMVSVFAEVWRVLRDDGVCWINIGDSYAGGGKGVGGSYENDGMTASAGTARIVPNGLKPKDLVGIPWRLAFALQDAGWYLRQDVIWCLSGGAWVYAKTQKGEMPVMVKDLVRLNPSTVKLWNGEKWTQVVGWGLNPDPKNRMELVLRSGERIGCTGDHLWPTQRGNVPASSLVVGDVIQTCRLPEPQDAKPPGHLPESAAWLIGLYLAEGSRADDTIQLSLCADEQHWVPRIESVASHYGGTVTHTIKGNNLSVRMYGRMLVALLEEYIGGSTAKDKHLKVSAWKLPDSSLREIANGYLDGDGHDDAKNGRYRIGFTRNYSLERDLRTLAARLGACLTINPAKSSCQTGNHDSFRGEWRWERSGHWNEKERGEIVAIRSSRARQFWDISVEDDPHLFALTSGVLTHNCKPNPMPESVRDRCTKAHEYVFLLTKSARYFFDGDAIKTKTSPKTLTVKTTPRKGTGLESTGEKLNAWMEDNGGRYHPEESNRRSVWTIATHSYRGAHFATYPPKLVEPCILAGTSARGCCPTCGAPWRRVVESQRVATRPGTGSKVTGDTLTDGNRDPQRHVSVKKTTGWEQACKCDAHEPIPCTVLDPFMGSGTTAIVAEHHGREWIGCELSEAYAELARQRIAEGWHPKPEKRKRLKRAKYRELSLSFDE